MHHDQDQRPQGLMQETRASLNILLAIMQIVGAPWRIWMTRFGTWGERFADGRMALGWFFMPFWTGFFPHEDGRPMLAVWIATTMLLIVHRIAGMWRRRKGYRPHSRDCGISWLGRGVKAFTGREMVLGLAVGLPLCPFVPAVGAWILASSLCQAFVHAWQESSDLAVARRINDARLEQEHLARLAEKEAGDN